MLVKQIMSQPVLCCHKADSLNVAAQKMWEADCGVMPIVDDSGQTVAMLTDRDICMAAYTQGKLLVDIPVSVAMSRGLVACSPDDSLLYAEMLMRNYQLHRLPVLDADNKLVGILALNDLACAAARQQHYIPGGSNIVERLISIARTVAAVCAQRQHGGRPGWQAGNVQRGSVITARPATAEAAPAAPPSAEQDGLQQHACQEAATAALADDARG